MIKNLLIIVLSLSMVTSCLAVKRVKEVVTEPSTGGFVPNFPDVPMPPHFVADAGTSSFFDSAEGRIAEISAEGFASQDQIEKFYHNTMSQFGWQQLDKLIFKRSGELLTISTEKGKSLTTIKYQLRPAV